jgi:transposase
MSRQSPNKLLRKSPFDSDKTNIAKLVNNGWSDARIAQHYNVNRDTIYCRRQRWNLPNGCDVKADTNIEAITQLWTTGYTVAEIAEYLHISEPSVYTKIRKTKLRAIPRIGIDAPSVSLSDLRNVFSDAASENKTYIVTYNKLPRWVLVPIEDYQDLKSGVYNSLRSEVTHD